MAEKREAVAGAATLGGRWVESPDGSVGLRISVCPDCGARWYPPRPACSTCLSEAVEDELADPRGVVYSSTVVHTGPARFEPPYALAYVDVSGVRVLSRVVGTEALAPGSRVRLRVGWIGTDGSGEIVSHVAEPEEGRAAGRESSS